MFRRPPTDIPRARRGLGFPVDRPLGERPGRMANMKPDEFPFPQIGDFLRKVMPFDTLDDGELARIVSRIEIAYYPRGTVIVRQGSPSPDFLYIVHVGSVRITISGGGGEEILTDFRGEADAFGGASILQGSESLAEITATEDSILYLLPADVFRHLVNTNPAFERTFKFSLANYIKGACDSRYRQLSQPDGTRTINLDFFLAGKLVSDLMVRNLVTCGPDMSIRDAAAKMTRNQVSSIVVTDGRGTPLGVMTNRDLRSRVVAEGRSGDESVSGVMNRALHSVDRKTYAIDALLHMSEHHIRHLLVMDGDSAAGILSEHDFQVEVGSSPLGIIAQIEKAQTVDHLARLRKRIDNVLEMLLMQGVPVDKVVSLVTGINDRVTQRVLSLVEHAMADSGMGPAPVPYCWMALGSEGRREQTLLTDQDNSLSYADVPGEDGERVRRWFLAFSEGVVDGLVLYGIPRCPGGIMASNPSWCQPEGKWRETFSKWVLRPDPLAVMLSMIFFDFRAVHGGTEFIAGLREELHGNLRKKKTILELSAREALENPPPIGFFREFIVERSGEHRNQLDLKRRGLRPVIEAARIRALDLGVDRTNTMERLEAVRDAGILDDGLYSDIREAYHFMNRLRIDRYLDAVAMNRDPDNFIDPATLNSLQRNMLKESFSAVARLQKKLLGGYLFP